MGGTALRTSQRCTTFRGGDPVLVSGIEIVRVDLLSDEEYRELHEWGDDVFGTAPLNLTFRPKDQHFLLYDCRHLASHVGVLTHTVSADGRDMRVGGIGGVVTVPAAQRRGFARTLMKFAADWLDAEQGVESGLLFCLPRMVAYYEPLGWQLVDGSVGIEQPGGRIDSPLCVMLLPFGDAQGRVQTLDLRSLPW
jgi:GNAT superfamily N-acetyltransferase